MLSRVQVKDTFITWDSNVAIVELVVDIQHERQRTFTGSARRHPDDRPDADVAILLAQARAYTSLANALNRRAKGLVAHKDDVKRLKERRAPRTMIVSSQSTPRVHVPRLQVPQNR